MTLNKLIDCTNARKKVSVPYLENLGVNLQAALVPNYHFIKSPNEAELTRPITVDEVI